MTTTTAPQLTAIHCASCGRVLILLTPGVFRREVTITCPDCGRKRVLPPIGARETAAVDRMCYTESAPY